MGVQLQVRIVADGEGTRPPTGTPVRIEIRDVTEQDAASTVVASVDTEVADVAGLVDDDSLATAALELVGDELDPRRDFVVWARVAASGSPRVDAGDWITMGSVPVPAGAADEIDVEVRPVG